MDPTTGVAWESAERAFFDRLWSTVRDATIDPVATFRAMGIPGSSGAALRLTLITSMIGYLPLLALVPCLGVFMLTMASMILNAPGIPPEVRGLGAGALCGIVAAIPIFVVVFSLYVEISYGLAFHLFSRIAGGKGDFGSSMRAMLYTGAIRTWLLPLVLVSPIPIIGFIIHWGGRFLMLVWSGFAVYGAALGVHQLPEDRAIFVGIATPCAVALLALLGFGGTIAGLSLLLFGGFAGLGNLVSR